MTFTDYVRVDCPTFGDDILGHIQEIRGTFATVRVELDDDHPAMLDARADMPYIEEPEFISIIHVQDIRTLDGVPYMKTRAWVDEVARQEAEEFNRRMAKAEERIRDNRPKFPELDWMIEVRHAR